jgi:hypothetical protein
MCSAGPERVPEPRTPVSGADIQEIQADDDLIEALRKGQITACHPEPVAAALARWRASILTDCHDEATRSPDVAHRPEREKPKRARHTSATRRSVPLVRRRRSGNR